MKLIGRGSQKACSRKTTLATEGRPKEVKFNSKGEEEEEEFKGRAFLRRYTEWLDQMRGVIEPVEAQG
ncbi:hypothetical protein SLEP1_g56507 [Rubroshorea leprosula]|uniref:Uncharacterized protein n=1 Tax=Rubroshorea leprosula TaxID=152421 RepID=A0AAV5MIY9_9ROSI|nr:hypothetical protein SLEP1_g56507 [Rubroshorea leprosula]